MSTKKPGNDPQWPADHVERRPVETLIPYARNARTHSDAQVAQIAASMQEWGWTQPVLIDEQGGIIAGHGRVLAARKLGIVEIPVMVARNWTDAQKRAYILADNKLALNAGWDEELLKVELGELKDMAGLIGFSQEELNAVLKGGKKGTEGLTDEDAIPDPPIVPSTRIGDLWLLGDHRLLCGDSTDIEHIARLMNGERADLFATDPPYLVNYDGTNHPGQTRTCNKDWGDTYNEQGWDDERQGQQFYLDFYRAAQQAAIKENAAWYCWHASKRQAMLEDTWIQCGAFVHQQIIWVKSRPVLTYSVFLWAHEPCLMGWIKGKKPKVNRSGVDQFPSSVWDRDAMEQYGLTIWDIKSAEIENNEHPTSKPVRVFTIPMQLHTEPGDLCYEPFTGSGSQIIAAEKTGRRCFGLELSPVYCDVIVNRWQAFTGAAAILEGDGRTFDEVAHERAETETDAPKADKRKSRKAAA